MAVDDRTRLAVPFILRIALIGALAGAAYGYFAATAAGGSGVYGVARGLLTGGIIGGLLSALNYFILEAPRRGGVRRAPFLLHVALKSLIYLVVFVLGAWLGQRLVPIPGGPRFEIGLDDILYFVAISFVVSFVLDLNGLI